MRPDAQPAALLVTGTVGSGKTTVVEAIGDVLADRGRPHALVDLDHLGRLWPPPHDDQFNRTLELRNVRAVIANYRVAGAQTFVLAGVVESAAEVDEYAHALGCGLLVVRLRVHPDALLERLNDRHRQDPERLAWHLARAPELDGILDRAAFTDVEIDTTARLPRDVAVDVLLALGWD